MTPEERRRHLDLLIDRQGWSLTPEVRDYVANAEALDSPDQLELVLTVAMDIAGLRGEPLSIAIVEKILAPPAAPRVPYPAEVSPIFGAIEDGEPVELRRAVRLRGADLEEISDYHGGKTPLLLALEHRDLASVKVLIEAGARADHRGRSPSAPVHLAMLGRGAKRLQLLLDAGADVNALDGEGRTALHLAAVDDRNLDRVEALLAAGADRTIQGPGGELAVDVARRCGAVEITARLLGK